MPGMGIGIALAPHRPASPDAPPSEPVELAPGGDFETDEGWTDGAGYWVLEDGFAACEYVGGGHVPYVVAAAALLTNGMSVEVTFTVLTRSQGGVRPYVGGTFGTIRTAAGTYTETIITTAANQNIGVQATGVVTSLSIDDYSAVEAS